MCMFFNFRLIAAFLLLAVATTQSAELQCTYFTRIFTPFYYECWGNIEVSPSDNTVASVTGNHQPNMTNVDVLSVAIFNNSLMSAMPKNLKLFFPNYVQLRLFGLKNFPDFSLKDFSELSHLKSLVIGKLPLVTQVPKDALKNFNDLEYLLFVDMPNLENFDADLLVNARKLYYFAVQGSNKINQISPGFFRGQENSLQTINFANTNLLKINYNVFDNLKRLIHADFRKAGCLNTNFVNGDVKAALINEVRNNCQNVNSQSDNKIFKKISYTSSSSE